MDIRVFDKLHTISQGVISMIDLSEIEYFTSFNFQQFLVGCFQLHEILPPTINRIMEYGFAIRILGQFSNIQSHPYKLHMPKMI